MGINCLFYAHAYYSNYCFSFLITICYKYCVNSFHLKACNNKNPMALVDCQKRQTDDIFTFLQDFHIKISKDSL